MAAMIAALKAKIQTKERELKELRAALSAIYEKKQATCKHPNRDYTPYEHFCPDCGWSKDRSF